MAADGAGQAAALERAVVVVLDGVGVGQAPDAAAFGDEGANSLGNAARAVGGMPLPHLGAMGLGNITPIEGTAPVAHATGAYGRMDEVSPAKDSTTGHWELMGLPLARAMPTYPHGFPPDVIARFEAAIGRGTLGNKPASGTEIIEELGAEHMRAGKPIVYTSADSVFQIAAHEEVIPLEELYRMSEIARAQLSGEHAVGRVIARPFVGTPGSFTRTPRRKDFSLEPPGTTLLDELKSAGYDVIGVGKIEDLFVMRGLTKSSHPGTNEGSMQRALEELGQPFHGLLFVNLVDMDQLYGHRRNPQGYARAMEEVDAWVPQVQRMLGPRDALFITGDHGNDPTYRGTDHTREAVPILVTGAPITPNVNLGVRRSFADLGQTLAAAFGIPPLPAGASFAQEIGLDGIGAK
ncbi:MAG TPA: phosphopentomutase [Ktedonobacterales bacterium]|nr:phosphopentomutase [Ktedonobacterales bacterium]